MVNSDKEIIFGKAINQLIHDIRNYLNTIIGFSSILENNNNLKKDEMLFVRKILDAGYSIENLLSNINDYLNDDFNLELKKININGLINDFLNSQKSEFDERKFKVNFNSEDEITIDISEEILKKIFECLLSFSFKGLRGNQEKSIDIILYNDKNSAIILYTDSSNYIPVEKNYFNFDEILQSKRGFGLFFLEKYVKIINGKIKYLTGNNWVHANKRKFNINQRHGFQIILTNLE